MIFASRVSQASCDNYANEYLTHIHSVGKCSELHLPPFLLYFVFCIDLVQNHVAYIIQNEKQRLFCMM